MAVHVHAIMELIPVTSQSHDEHNCAYPLTNKAAFTFSRYSHTSKVTHALKEKKIVPRHVVVLLEKSVFLFFLLMCDLICLTARCLALDVMSNEMRYRFQN
ncbi:hypothetical protein AVEN_199664-1 [Araneus ventricosus]|uniref:Uncharacterized protein n=1 Tax=Araneus ventricosus TaxID=182803 RepID=A0A4Y2DFF1_ARAVE|nr:hypothetical protein AVEN_199664-1 [Araneus ventricosus]